MIENPVRLSNGIVIEPSHRTSSGYKNSSYNTNQRQFLAWVKKEPIEKLDRRVNIVQPGSSPTFTLGWFNDAREAAYAGAYFLSKPEELLKRYFSLVTRDDVRNGRAQIFTVLDIDFPDDLYDLPEPNMGDVSTRPVDKKTYADDPAEVLIGIKDKQETNAAEDIVNELLQSKPEWINALRAVAPNNRVDAKKDAIDAIKNGKSEEEALEEILGFHGLTESILYRILTLSNIK